MIAADEWHKYQESYVKYGIDLEPEKERPKREPVKEPVIRVTAKEKGHILLVIAVIGICCIAVIFLQACASSINYSINSLNQEISVLEGDIDNLHVQLNSSDQRAVCLYERTGGQRGGRIVYSRIVPVTEGYGGGSGGEERFGCGEAYAGGTCRFLKTQQHNH